MSLLDTVRKALGYVLLSMGVSRPAPKPGPASVPKPGSPPGSDSKPGTSA
jgi:hypothetical protein